MANSNEEDKHSFENRVEIQRPSSAADLHVLLLPFRDLGHINPLMQLGRRLAARGVKVTMAVPDHVRSRILKSQPNTSRQQPHESMQIVSIKEGVKQGDHADPPRHHGPDDGLEEGAVELVQGDHADPPRHHGPDEGLEEGAVELVQDLASNGRPVTCIVADVFWDWTRSLAARTKLTDFVFWSMNVSTLCGCSNTDDIRSAGHDPSKNDVGAMSTESSKDPEQEANRLPESPSQDGPFDDGLMRLRDSLMNRLSGPGSCKGVICNSFAALETEAIRKLNLQLQSASPNPLCGQSWPSVMGPLVPDAIFEGGTYSSDEGSVEDEGADCLKWLDEQPAGSVLYVAFGSIQGPMSSKQGRELALGLAASGQRFLWVLPGDAIMAEGTEEEEGPGGRGGPGRGPDRGRGRGPGGGRGRGRGPPPPPPGGRHGPRGPPGPPHGATTPARSMEEMLPPGFLEQNHHMCKLVRWAPQAWVLSHAAVGGFLSHCGWNSTLEGICSGVPILGWPGKMDQYTNSWLVTHVWKAGLSLELDSDGNSSSALVEKGVRQLMEGPEAPSFRARARELAQQARKAFFDTDAVSSLVDDLWRASTSS